VLEHELDVSFKGLDIRNLISRKVRSQQMTAVSPSLAICVEDAMAEQRLKSCLSVLHAEVFELQAQYRLDILRLARRNNGERDHPRPKRVSIFQEPLLVFLQTDAFLAIRHHQLYEIQSQEWIFVDAR
jgi:hypothetical protein